MNDPEEEKSTIFLLVHVLCHGSVFVFTFLIHACSKEATSGVIYN